MTHFLLQIGKTLHEQFPVAYQAIFKKQQQVQVVDVAFDPRNPNILFAALWETRRTP